MNTLFIAEVVAIRGTITMRRWSTTTGSTAAG